MAAHRYWRVYVSNVTSTTILFAGLELRTTSGGTNLATTGNGTATESSFSSVGYEGSKLFDSNSATYWNSSAAAPGWVYWDFGAGNEQEINSITIVNGNSTANNPVAGYFSYSDDAVTWVLWQTFASANTAIGISTEYFQMPPSTGILNKSLPMLLVTGDMGGSVVVDLPAMSGVGYGAINSNNTLPMLSFVGSGGSNLASVLPAITAFGSGHETVDENSVIQTLPALTLAGFGGANSNSTLPALTFSGDGITEGWGIAELTLPSLAGAGTGLVPDVGKSNTTLPMLDMVGYSGAVCSVTIGILGMAATGLTGATGDAAMTLPLFELVATGTREDSGSAELTLPALMASPTGTAWIVLPEMTLTAIGTATVTATYEAYAVNIKHTGESPDEVTRYTNFPFTHIVRYQNSYFGANETGLYLLEGTTDYAATPTAIPWAFKTAVTDFGYPEFKTIESAYLGGRLGPAATMTLYAGEGEQTQAYHYTTPRGELAQNYRQKFGKGIRDHRYYAFGANGSGELAVDSIDFKVAKLSRRI